MTILELFSGKLPFQGVVSESSLWNRIRQGPLPQRPTRMINEWWELCTSCWESEPVLRPTMSDLVKIIEAGVPMPDCNTRVPNIADN
ncbi:hypothetical protein J3A83DRAFT_1574178 [Scleroderma citrinum]